MSKKLFVSLLCALAVLLAFSGCKKEEAKPAEAPAAEAPAADAAKADEAKPADAKADEAKPAEAKADEAKPAADIKPDLAQAAKDAVEFMSGLSKSAVDAGEDCAKMGTDMTKYLTDNKDKFVNAMKALAKVEEDSAEMKALESELQKVSDIMGDESDFKKAIDKCQNAKEVEGFSIAFLGVMMAVAAEENAAAPAEAPAEEAKAAE